MTEHYGKAAPMVAPFTGASSKSLRARQEGVIKLYAEALEKVTRAECDLNSAHTSLLNVQSAIVKLLLGEGAQVVEVVNIWVGEDLYQIKRNKSISGRCTIAKLSVDNAI